MELTAEIYNHTRNKSEENYQKLKTLYSKKPLSFKVENSSAIDILKNDITLPVNYKPSKKMYDEYNTSMTSQLKDKSGLYEYDPFLEQQIHIDEQLRTDETAIRDVRKLSASRNAYGFYKKLGWKSSFIKYKQ